mmetsp:Transcript_24232/g.42897  ORF Transcript_24232/g.42897 Transcript_24232/m.42897 type:complete len:365 (-) Transcript_24232:556-1650(-)
MESSLAAAPPDEHESKEEAPGTAGDRMSGADSSLGGGAKSCEISDSKEENSSKSEGGEASSSLADKVTLIMATSPVKSNPSTALLEYTMRTIRVYCEGISDIKKIIVCDGYTLDTEKGEGAARKGRRISTQKAEDYKEYIKRIHNLCESGNENFSRTSVLVLKKLHGFGLAMQQALEHVKTEYVFVAQHDRVFVEKATALAPLVKVLDHDKKVNYIGYLTHRQINYRHRMTAQHGLKIPTTMSQGLELCPLIHFLDSMHIARTSFWEYMFKTGTIKIRDFPEHTFGNVQRWDCVKNGMQAFEKYGTYLLWDGKCVVKHVNGRTFLDKNQRLAKGYPASKELDNLIAALEEEDKKSTTTGEPSSV